MNKGREVGFRACFLIAQLLKGAAVFTPNHRKAQRFRVTKSNGRKNSIKLNMLSSTPPEETKYQCYKKDKMFCWYKEILNINSICFITKIWHFVTQMWYHNNTLCNMLEGALVRKLQHWLICLNKTINDNRLAININITMVWHGYFRQNIGAANFNAIILLNSK